MFITGAVNKDVGDACVLTTPRTPLYSSITFSAAEYISGAADGTHTPAGGMRVELFSSHQTLWDDASASASTSAAGTAATTLLPTSLPFSFDVTPDLPHCIHLARSGLAYTLRARLHAASTGAGAGAEEGEEGEDAVREVPVHLTRYTPPGALHDLLALGEEDDEQDAPAPAPGLGLGLGLGATAAAAAAGDRSALMAPYTWSVAAPTAAHVQLSRTLFRRAEPLELRIKIPPPAQGVLTEKGLRLRAVEADLVRIIRVLPDGNEGRTGGETGGGASERLKGKSFDDTVASTSTSTSPATTATATAGGAGASAPLRKEIHESLLAHSGKLCRFHSQRPIVLRLSLHPPFDSANMPHPHPDHDALAHSGSSLVFGRRPGGGGGGGGGGCECISQETLLHAVEFEVRVRIALYSSAAVAAAAAAAPGAGGSGGAGSAAGGSSAAAAAAAASGAGSSTTASGARRDIRLHKRVHILPGAAGRVLQFSGPSGHAAPQGESSDGGGGGLEMTTVTSTGGSSGIQSAGHGEGSSSMEKKKAKEAEAHAEETLGPFAGFDAEPEFDGYEDIGRSLSARSSEDGHADLSEQAGLEGLSESDQRNLAQLRQYLDRLESDADAPPPTLQESQNDFQVEVEVEGVGMAMPRDHLSDADVAAYAARHDYQHAADAAADLYDPPPPMSPVGARPPSSGPGAGALPLQAVGEPPPPSIDAEPHASTVAVLPPSFGDATASSTRAHTRNAGLAFPPPYHGSGAVESSMLLPTRGPAPGRHVPPPPPPQMGFPPAYAQASSSPAQESGHSASELPSYED